MFQQLGGVSEAGDLGSQGWVDLREECVEGMDGPAAGLSDRVPVADDRVDGARGWRPA
jgi:hypothetical protein